MIGPHVIRPTDAAMEWARSASIVKGLDTMGVLAAAPAGAVRIFRHYLSNQNLNDPEGTAETVLAALGGYRHPSLYVELWNETHPTADQLRRAVAVCHAAGVKVAGPSWGTGDYTADDWEVARQAGVDAVAVHAYWAGAGFTPWNALRYRQFWRPGDPPVVITECGRDRIRDGANGTYIGNGGWKADGISADAYLAELLAYAAEIAKDQDHLLGATVFTAGASPDWSNYDLDELAPRLATAGSPTIPSSSPASPAQGVSSMSEDERKRYFADLWNRHGAVYAPGNGISDEWTRLAESGTWIGAPSEPEHPSENGRYIFQSFASDVLTFDKETGQVTRGLPPLA